MRFVALDSWRGICALLVAVHNLAYAHAPAFVLHSFLFVDFFFVLSGFVITHAYVRDLESGASVGVFLLRRFGRLWPLHIALLFAFIGLELLRLVVGNALHATAHGAFEPPNSIVAALKNVLLIQAIGIDTRLSWNVPSWSISTEFWTYLAFALICLASPRRRPPALVIGAIVLFAAVVIALSVPDFLASNTHWAVLRCIYGFFAGHLAYRLWLIGAPKRLPGTILELLAVVLVAMFVYVAGDDSLSMLAPIVFGFAVWVFANERGACSRLLSAGVFRQLGEWSYSIYMVHWLVRTAVKVVVAASLGGLPGAQSPLEGIDAGFAASAIIVAYLAAVILVSAITYRLIEAPARRYFNSISESLTQNDHIRHDENRAS